MVDPESRRGDPESKRVDPESKSVDPESRRRDPEGGIRNIRLQVLKFRQHMVNTEFKLKVSLITGSGKRHSIRIRRSKNLKDKILFDYTF